MVTICITLVGDPAVRRLAVSQMPSGSVVRGRQSARIFLTRSCTACSRQVSLAGSGPVNLLADAL